jgi:hypothetical protein
MALQLCPDCGVETGRGTGPSPRCAACARTVRLLQAPLDAPLFTDWELDVDHLDELLTRALVELYGARLAVRLWDERASYMRDTDQPLDNYHLKRASIDRATCTHLERQRSRIAEAIAKRDVEREAVRRRARK